MRIVNTDLGIDLTFEKGVEPKELLRRISSEPGAAGSIGLIGLRSLLNGELSDVSNYVIFSEEDDEAAAAEAEAAAALAAEQTVQAAEVKTEDATEAEAAAPAVEGDTTAVSDQEAVPVAVEGAPVQEAAPEVVADDAKDQVAEGGDTQEPQVTAKEAVKKAFGITADPVTPKASESAGVSRPRRDMSALITKAKAGVHGPLLVAVEAAGYTIVNVENTERWFGFNVPGGKDLRAAPRFDVSPLKNGSYSVSLYVNDRATKIKERLAPVDNAPVTPEMIIACMQSVIFKDKIEEGLAALPKDAE